jgi:hypothetical protein
MAPNSVYTYLYLRYCGTPYYVGKGMGKRAFSNIGRTAPKPKDETRIIIQTWDTEEEAFEAERFLIQYYGRLDLGTGCLRNRTDGGDGASGRILSEASIEKMRKSHLGMKPSKAQCRKISQALKGRAHTRQHNKAVGTAQRGVKNHRFGKKNSEEHCRKSGNAWRGKNRPEFSEEWKQRLSAAKLGKKRAPFSTETRRRMGEAQRARFSKGNL